MLAESTRSKQRVCQELLKWLKLCHGACCSHTVTLVGGWGSNTFQGSTGAHRRCDSAPEGGPKPAVAGRLWAWTQVPTGHQMLTMTISCGARLAWCEAFGREQAFGKPYILWAKGCMALDLMLQVWGGGMFKGSASCWTPAARPLFRLSAGS